MKTKRPYTQVLRVAELLIDRLTPACERIEIAGSLRRQCPNVGDIELIAVPTLRYNLLGEPLPQTRVDELLAGWPVTLTKNGEKYKQFSLQTTAGHTYQVDLFLQPDPRTWGVNMMIRTGSAIFSRRMVTPKSAGGYMPDRYRVHDARVWDGAQMLDTAEEADVFELWGMHWIEPERRDE